MRIVVVACKQVLAIQAIPHDDLQKGLIRKGHQTAAPDADSTATQTVHLPSGVDHEQIPKVGEAILHDAIGRENQDQRNHQGSKNPAIPL